MSQQIPASIATSTSLLDLPEEIKLEIARYVTTPDTTRHLNSWGYPSIPDLANTLRAVNRETSRLFCDVISKDYLHIEVVACQCALHPHMPLFSQLADQFQRNRRVPDTTLYGLSLGLDLSFLEIKIMCSDHCIRRQTQIKTFLATPDTILTLCGILQNLLPKLWTLRFETRCINPRTNTQATMILDEMRKILFQTRIATDSKLSEDYNLEAFCSDLGRQLSTPKDMILIFEAHLCAIQDAMDDGVPLEQVVSSLILYEYEGIRTGVFGPIMLWDIRQWKQSRRYLFELEITYDCAVLQGIASYLLSRKLAHEEQYHFCMHPSTTWMSRLEYILAGVDRSIRFYHEFEEDFPHNMLVTMGWMAPIFKARVEFLLAWARLNTLAEYPIQGYRYPKTPLHEDIEHLGDNQDEDFDYSTWGTPKSIVLVARRDMNKLNEWINDAMTNPEPREGVHSMDFEANFAWMWKMKKLADAIDAAQGKRAYDPTMGRMLLQDEMIEESLCTKLYYLPDAARREELHKELEEENWGAE